MTVTNIGNVCLIYQGETVQTQPALTGVEMDILRAMEGELELSISALSALTGCSYGYTWGMVWRLVGRGLLDLRRTSGKGNLIKSLAKLVDHG